MLLNAVDVPPHAGGIFALSIRLFDLNGPINGQAELSLSWSSNVNTLLLTQVSSQRFLKQWSKMPGNQ